MKAEELRIGNYVYPFDDIDLVDNKTIVRDCIKVSPQDFENTKHLEPIPLTEEWLLKFGFNTDDDNCYFLDINSNCYLWKEKNEGVVFLYDSSENEIQNVKYIHQLQNLYYALTSKELTIKK